MRAGDLRTKLLIEAVSGSAWQPVDSVWGKVTGRRGANVGAGSAIAPESDTEVLIRFRNGLTFANRLRTGSRILWIDAVVQPTDLQRELQIYCTENAGAAIAFTQQTRTRTASTDAATVSSSTINGYAREEAGDRKQYEALSLIERNPATIRFRPVLPGVFPALGASCSWGGMTRTVKSVDPIAPLGTVVAARIVLAR